MVAEEENLDPQEVERMSDWLWHFLVEHTGEDRYFDLLLGRYGQNLPPHPQNGSEIDRLVLFREIVDYLIILRQGEREAAQWLFNNAAFEAAVGESPFQYIEDGEFQALSLLHDWLQIAVHHYQASSDTSDSVLSLAG